MIPEVAALLEEVSQYPSVAGPGRGRRQRPGRASSSGPLERALGDHELSLFTTLTTFGTPRDITLDELAIELFYPADDATTRLLTRAG